MHTCFGVLLHLLDGWALISSKYKAGRVCWALGALCTCSHTTATNTSCDLRALTPPDEPSM